MEFKGDYRIPASRERVWAGLNDPEVLRLCIPGCEAMTKRSDTEYVATVASKLGPMRVRFTGKVTLSELDPPNGYVITGEGQGGVAGFAKGSARVALADDTQGTLLTYTAQGSVGGKLAQLGARLIDATAHKMAEDFFGKFSEQVGAPPVPLDGLAQTPALAEPPMPEATVTEPAGTASPGATKGIPTALWVVGLIAIVAAILALFAL